MLDLIPNSSAEKGRSTQGQKTEMMKLVREPVAEYLDFHVARTIENRAFQKRTAEVKTLGGEFHTFPLRNPKRTIAAYPSGMSFSKSA